MREENEEEAAVTYSEEKFLFILGVVFFNIGILMIANIVYKKGEITFAIEMIVNSMIVIGLISRRWICRYLEQKAEDKQKKTQEALEHLEEELKKYQLKEISTKEMVYK